MNKPDKPKRRRPYRRKIRLRGLEPKEQPPSSIVPPKRQGIETPDGLIDEVIASRILGLKPRTLANRRSLGMPPEYVKRGRRVFYERSHIEAISNLPQEQW